VAADKSAVVKLQAPVLLAVAVPSAVAPPSDTVTVEPSGAVPVKVTDSLEFVAPVLMTGAAGGFGGGEELVTVTSKALDAALVPADVVSVAVKA
jgi:hypothetical protein